MSEFRLPSPIDKEAIGPDAVLLRRFALRQEAALLKEIEIIAKVSPFRHMTTRRGHKMSVAMTNCGQAGWVSDRRGYRYEVLDAETGRSWPEMPALFSKLAQQAAEEAGFHEFLPDVCLINRYEPTNKLSLHQDRDERSFDAPIVSVSLGLTARFLFGGLRRTDRVRRDELESGDVVVWGRASRLAWHGIDPVGEGVHPLTGRIRFNLTFRRALS